MNFSEGKGILFPVLLNNIDLDTRLNFGMFSNIFNVEKIHSSKKELPEMN
jgi:hypothetical protein